MPNPSPNLESARKTAPLKEAPPALLPSHPFLISLDNPDQVIPVTEFFTIGSDDDCGLTIRDQTINGRHARIERRGHEHIIKDLRSPLGTFLNEIKIIEAVIRSNDILRIGTHEFKFNPTQNINSEKNTLLKSKNSAWNMELSRIHIAATTPYPVLLLGPSGTGKEVIAREIHRASARTGPLITVNCSALTESLVESELFGHIKGSFTGAVNDRKGAFESARGGTLFLDEIGDLPYPLQAKLLRALENSEIRPVGSDRIVQTDVRIIAATHQDLLERIEKGTFRYDLFYRLNVVNVKLPPLNQRMEDFEDLLYFFAKQFRVRFSHGAIQCLKNYDWPGNIRELKNSVARAHAFFSGHRIDESNLDLLIQRRMQISPEEEFQKSLNTQLLLAKNSSSGMPLIKEVEKKMITNCLIANRGNQRKSAAILGLPKSTLNDRIREYQINVQAMKSGSQNPSMVS